MTPVGQLAVRAILPLVHWIRRRGYPDLPKDQSVVRVFFRDKQLQLIYRRQGSDREVIDQCFAEAQYDFPGGPHGLLLQALYKEILAAGRKPLIIDCGANIGASVVWFNARYPEAHIVAVEPAPDNFAVLTRNCANLDVDLRQAGVAATDGVAYLSSHDECYMGYRTNTDHLGQQIAVVSVATLVASKSPERYTPFLLKIDIEGAEKGLFQGDCAALNRFPLIILEPHDRLFPGQLTSLPFFQFHAAAGREFCAQHENVASIVCHDALPGMVKKGS